MVNFLAGKCLNASALKYLACAFMLIDHIGDMLLPEYRFLRIIGRLAFPIFAFMIANGYHYTSSPAKYLLRIAVFAVGFQWFYAKFASTDTLSIFATLTLGLLAIWLADLIKKQLDHKYLALVLMLIPGAAFAYLGELIAVDYGWYGVALIFTAWLFYQRLSWLALSWMALNIAYVLIYSWPGISIQVFSLGSLALIYCYNGERGKSNRWFFYIFYCVHLAILYLLQQWLF